MPIRLTIDGKSVTAQAGQTILSAALENGIYIPHLCSKEELLPSGACRMCVVSLQGREGVVTACSTPVEEGMVVNSHSLEAERIRQLCCDLLFKRHPSECTNCPRYGQCQLQSISQYVGDTGRKLHSAPLLIPNDESDPVICHEMHRCILCARCVRACQQLRGVGVLKMEKVNGRLRVVIDGDSLNAAGCRYCTACVEVCPTGAIHEQKRLLELAAGKSRSQALVPCRDGCPAQVDVPRYIRAIKAGRYDEAAAVVRERAAMPMVLGYICSHPCEAACKHACLNEAVNIRALKRFAAENAGDAWLQYLPAPASTGKRIAVVGAGPAGLTAAWLLSLKGHDCTILEKEEKPGGQLRYGIPAYRLPREVLDHEIDRLLNSRIHLKMGVPVEDVLALRQEGYDAVIVAVGTHEGVRLNIPGVHAANIYTSVELLKAFETGEPVHLGSRTLILGGGNVAMDCAGAARRLGCDAVHIACLESADAMPAAREEKALVLEEGAVIHNSKTFLEIVQHDGLAAGVRCASVRSSCFDPDGRLVLDVIPGSEEVLEADSVIFAVGQRPGLTAAHQLPLGRGGRVVVCKDGITCGEGVFAAGDCVSGTASVIQAIAVARKAASACDTYLGGDGVMDLTLCDPTPKEPELGREPGFGSRMRMNAQMLPPQERVCSRQCIECCYSLEEAQEEAVRCLQCDLRLDIVPQHFWSDYERGGRADDSIV